MGKRKVTVVETEEDVRTLEQCDFCSDKSEKGSFNELYFNPEVSCGMRNYQLDEEIELDGFFPPDLVFDERTKPALIYGQLKHLDDPCFDAFREGLNVDN